jgi:hypothetical protein
MHEENIKITPTKPNHMLGHPKNLYVATRTSPLSPPPFPFPSLSSVGQQRDLPGDGPGKNVFQPLKDSTFPPLDFDMDTISTVKFCSRSNLLEKCDTTPSTTPTIEGDYEEEEEEEVEEVGDDIDEDDLLLPPFNLEPEADITRWLASLPSHACDNAPYPPPSSSPPTLPKGKDAFAQSSEKTAEPSTIQQQSTQLTGGPKRTNDTIATATSKQTSLLELCVNVPAAGTISSEQKSGPLTPSVLITKVATAPIALPITDTTVPADAAASPSLKMYKLKNPRAKTMLQGVTTEMLVTLGYFDLKIGDAAIKLGVGVTSLKRHCRVNLGIKRWPSRERKSLAALQKYSGIYASKGLLGMSETKLAAELVEYEALLDKIPDAPMPIGLRRVRQKIFKLDHNKRRIKGDDDDDEDEMEVELGEERDK